MFPGSYRKGTEASAQWGVVLCCSHAYPTRVPSATKTMSDKDVSRVLNRTPSALDLAPVTVDCVFKRDWPLSKREEYRSARKARNETGHTV